MARYNEILVGRYNRFLQKFLGMKGGPPSPQLASEIVASWAMFHGVENRYLEGWNTFGASAQQPAVAAQNTGFRLRNPSGSNVIAVIFKITDTNPGVADNPVLQQAAIGSDLATLVSLTASRFDPRGNPQPTCIFSSGNNVAALGLVNKLAYNIQPNTNQELLFTDIHEVPLLPGDAYQILSSAVNVLKTVNFWWRERFLEDSERF